MAWTPEKNVVDLRGVIDNILAYLEANQADAHTWANDGPTLTDYAKMYPNATGRLATLFPQLMVLDQEHASEESETENGDILVTQLALTFEAGLTGPVADDLVQDTKKYAMALESMLMNIPIATLTTGNLTPTYGTCFELQTAFDILQGNGGKTASSWLQVFQTRVRYRLITSVF